MPGIDGLQQIVGYLQVVVGVEVEWIDGGKHQTIPNKARGIARIRRPEDGQRDERTITDTPVSQRLAEVLFPLRRIHQIGGRVKQAEHAKGGVHCEPPGPREGRFGLQLEH